MKEADPNDARELLNYKRAFSFVSGYLNSKKPVTEALIREIQNRLVERVRGGAAQPGTYRRVQNYVVDSAGEVVYTPPPPYEVAPLMRELIEYLGEEHATNPVLLAGIAQFQLVHIHPFVDGNGRTARLLSTLCLYRAGYDFKRLFSISEFYDRDRRAYYKAIQGVRDGGMNHTGWLEYFVTGLATQMREVQQRGERAMRRDIIAQKHELSQRQRKVLGHLMEHGSMTIKEFEALCSGITRRTLQRELKDMLKMGLVSAAGATNRLQYRLGKKAR